MTRRARTTEHPARPADATASAQTRLFADDEAGALRPGLRARLRRLAEGPEPAWSEAEHRRDEDRETMRRLCGRAEALAAHFGLKFLRVEAEVEGVVEHYGVCYADGLIRIRLRHAKTGRLLKESSLMDTLCHELAHLKHFDHSIRFRRFHRRILDEARRRGWYRPGPARPRPQQRSFRMIWEGETP